MDITDTETRHAAGTGKTSVGVNATSETQHSSIEVLGHESVVESPEGEHPIVTEKSKKRLLNFSQRQRELSKKAKLENHVSGEPCHCKRFVFFEKNEVVENLEGLITKFKSFESKNSQDAFLANLIKTNTMK